MSLKLFSPYARFFIFNAPKSVSAIGLSPRPCWTAYSAPLDPLAGFGGGRGIKGRKES